jgi:protein SCO1/2
MFVTKTVFLALAMLVVACRGASDPAAGAGSLDAVLEGLALRDQDEARFDPERLRGKAVLVNFMFASCPTICPMQTRDLVTVQRALSDAAQRFEVVSISVDPERDTPAVLKRFAEANGVDLGTWTFLSASLEDTRRLTGRLGVFDPRGGSAVPSAHGTSLYLFDGSGRLIQRYAGVPVDHARITREVRHLLSRPH